MTIAYKSSVEKDLKRLSREVGLRPLRTIERTLTTGREGSALSGEFRGLHRLRAGDFRVIYTRVTGGYLILRIAHRRDIYRKGRPG